VIFRLSSFLPPVHFRRNCIKNPEALKKEGAITDIFSGMDSTGAAAVLMAAAN